MGARLTAQTSRRKLALVAHRHGPAVRAERNRRILHIPDGQRAPNRCAHATLGTGRPLPAYSRRLASLQAVEPFELCAWGVSAPRGCSCCLRPGTRVRAVTSAHRAIRSRLQRTQMLPAAIGRPTMAARQLAAVAQPLQGPVASARSCVPLRMRSITTGVSHLRSRSFIGPRSAYAFARCCRLRRRICDALLLFACPCWPTRIRRPEVPCASEKGSDRPYTSSLARIGDTAQSVRASDTSDCRYQHPAAMAAKFRSSPYERIYLF